MRAFGASAIIVLVLVSGCADTSDKPEDPPTPTTGVNGPSGAVIALDPCPANCFEPAIARDNEGRIFVVAAHENALAVSLDQGRTYKETRTPPLPPGAPSGVTQWDGTVAVGPDGRLYYYAFLAQPTGAILPAPPVGLQVATSTTAAESWDTNVFLSALDGPSEPVVSPWKSWLGFGQGSTVYLDYNSRGSGLWVTRSDDAGKTWGAFTRVQPPEDRIISVFMGPPVVDSKGRLYIPYFGDQSPNYPNPFLPQGHQLRVAISDDRGATFRQKTIATKNIPDYVGAFFPVMAIDNADRLVLVHWDPENRMQVRASFDRGDAWQGPVQWSGSNPRNAAPWIRIVDGRVSLMFYERGGMGYARGNLSGGTLGEPFERGVLPGTPAGGGDFIHFDLDDAGRLVVPVPYASARKLAVVFGPEWPAPEV